MQQIFTYHVEMSEPQFELQADLTRSKAVEDSIAELYVAFCNRKLSEDGPDVCTAPCCASSEAMNRIAHSAPADISSEDLREYHCAAKGLRVGQDLAFLLPRTLEFVAQGYDPKGIGLFALFGRKFAPIWDELTDREQAAVRRYCYELMRWQIANYPDGALEYQPLDLLEMAAPSGFDVEPLLDALADPPPTNGAVDVLSGLILDHAVLWREGRGLYDTDKNLAEHIAERLRSIIISPATRHLLESAALADGDMDRAERASIAHQVVEHEAENEVRTWW